MTTAVEECVEKQESSAEGSDAGLTLLDPDLEFIQDLSSHGGDTLKKCYQCATCSATCPISPDDKPFPRKEMVWAMWGLKDRLVKDPDIWLCHQCNDCSAICPRGENPGEILAVLRAYCYRHYAFPRFLGNMLYEPKFLPLVFGLPAVILLIVVGAFGNFHPEGEIIFKHFLPHPFPLDFLFVLASAFAAVSSVISALNFWKGLQTGPRPPRRGAKGFVAGLIEAAKEILPHSQFKECEKANPRYYSHLLTFYGFLALFVTTTAVFLGLYLFHLETPLSLVHPVKILGNLGALAFLVGTGMMLYLRLTNPERAGRSHYNDWLFIGLMFALAATGILSECMRLAGLAIPAYTIYFIHLVLILSMMLYFPYSKFAHMLYRALAIIYYRGFAAVDKQDNISENGEARSEGI